MQLREGGSRPGSRWKLSLAPRKTAGHTSRAAPLARSCTSPPSPPSPAAEPSREAPRFPPSSAHRRETFSTTTPAAPSRARTSSSGRKNRTRRRAAEGERPGEETERVFARRGATHRDFRGPSKSLRTKSTSGLLRESQLLTQKLTFESKVNMGIFSETGLALRPFAPADRPRIAPPTAPRRFHPPRPALCSSPPSGFSRGDQPCSKRLCWRPRRGRRSPSPGRPTTPRSTASVSLAHST